MSKLVLLAEHALTVVLGTLFWGFVALTIFTTMCALGGATVDWPWR